ncbi:RHS repeat protein [Bradyrhizobium sp. R2.2-H]|jgi:hypothetical protein|uniref:RHS repeat domain-containing protein n=1 Tax=unclassified Bradyrhizobium TaxID=2631580 RepID=UPI00104FC41C|nr:MULTISPECIES: RHS repeat domain-containing protein [unclassified Bradyrhizobium]TCU67439.1 RHS repeat protein [Bradyrhizobium sp. Y-H1]TCU68994.1 RHS repeat protein [Bradyrhizobium sp. R2.2-H]
MAEAQKDVRVAARVRATTALALIVLGSLTIASAGQADSSVSYGYDQVGRVTSAAYNNGLCIVYTYDANGNRTAQSYSMSSGPASQNWGAGVWGCYLKWTPH